MWIQHTAAVDADSPVGTTALIHEEYTLGERVEFNENGKVNVPAEVGKQLCDHYVAIVPTDETGDDSEAE